MPQNKEMRALCVSIHDVTPYSWPLCQRLLQAIDMVAEIPVTLLVVPAYHRFSETDTAPYDRMLEQRLARGDALALHGYTHLDEGPAPGSLHERFKRQVYTLGEGEFAAIDAADARQRIERGLAWFARRNWPVDGFVAPAWLMSEGGWQALNEFPFKYTTTLQRFYLLPERQALLSPSLVYAARNAWGRQASRVLNSAMSRAMTALPLVRLGLHPCDANHPALVAHYQKLIAHLLKTRKAMTKSAFANQW